MSVRGRNLVTGLPKSVEVTSEDCEEALRESTMPVSYTHLDVYKRQDQGQRRSDGHAEHYLE